MDSNEIKTLENENNIIELKVTILYLLPSNFVLKGNQRRS
jgi:hypothetical protein